MIELTALSGKKILVNFDLIKAIESAPDTILCFQDGSRLTILETFQEIQIRYIQLKKSISEGEQKWK